MSEAKTDLAKKSRKNNVPSRYRKGEKSKKKEPSPDEKESPLSMTIPIPTQMQHYFATDKTFIQFLVDTIQETVKEVSIELKPDAILLTVGHIICSWCAMIGDTLLGI